MEKLNEEVWPWLVLGYEGSHLRVNGLPQSLEQREITACIWRAQTITSAQRNNNLFTMGHKGLQREEGKKGKSVDVSATH